MNTTRHAFRAALAIASLMTTAPLHAQHGQGMGQMGGMMGMQQHMGMQEHMGQMMAIHVYAPSALLDQRTELALTPAQVTLLEGLADQIRQGDEKAHTAHNTHLAALTELFKQPAPDAAKVAEHARAAMLVMAEAHGAEFAVFARAKAGLTDEQRRKAEAWVAEHGMHEGAGAKHDGH